MPRWRKPHARKISQMNGRWRTFWSMPASATPHCAPSSSFQLENESTGITSCVCTRSGIHFVATRALKSSWHKMQAQATNAAAVCPECGTRLEGGFSRNLGRCMICLLRVGFDAAEESNEAPLSSVTDRLGIYRIKRRDDGSLWELGRGAMGVTYRALDTSLQRPVALKLIDSEWLKRGAEARERFMREARTAASLRHPNVATVYHFGIREENGQCFCAMELVEGETLEMRVRPGPGRSTRSRPSTSPCRSAAH